MGYHQAAPFRIIGVDLNNQPRYPFAFRKDDALELLDKRIDTFKSWADFIHVSPPCEGYSITRSLHDNEYPLLISTFRELLSPLGVPYIIENVPEAWWDMRKPITLCGSSFGLRVRRHRLFESNIPLESIPCEHRWQDEHKPYKIYVSRGRNAQGWRESGIQPVHGGGHNFEATDNLRYKSVAMGIDWLNNEEINQAIPPAYTRFLGKQVYAYLMNKVEVAA